MTTTEHRQPTTANCPAWCVEHERRHEGEHPDDGVLIHYGTKRDVTSRTEGDWTYDVRIHRYDWDNSEPEHVIVMLDDDWLSATEARALGEALIAAADETEDRCECGKPTSHLSADPDSAEWGCRVPIGMVDGRPIYSPTELSDPSVIH